MRVGKALMTVEGIGKQIDPDLDVFGEATPYFIDLMRKRYSPQRLGNDLWRGVEQLSRVGYDLPVPVFEPDIEGIRTLHLDSYPFLHVLCGPVGIGSRAVELEFFEDLLQQGPGKQSLADYAQLLLDARRTRRAPHSQQVGHRRPFYRQQSLRAIAIGQARRKRAHTNCQHKRRDDDIELAASCGIENGKNGCSFCDFGQLHLFLCSFIDRDRMLIKTSWFMAS